MSIQAVTEQTTQASINAQETQAAQAQQATQEQSTQAAAPKPQAPAISERIAALVRKEKRALRAQEEAKKLAQQHVQRQADLDAREARIKEFEALKNASPLDKLKFLGTDYNELTQWFINNGNPTPEIQVQSVKKELEELRKQQEERERLRAEEEKKSAQTELEEVTAQFRREINQFTKEKGEDYELINLFDQSSLVYDTIQAYFDEHKKILSIKEASDLVEKYLEDQVKKTTETKKFKKLYSSEQVQAAKTEEPNLQSRNTTQSRTLTNDLTSSSASFLPAKTEQERMQRALAALSK